MTKTRMCCQGVGDITKADLSFFKKRNINKKIPIPLYYQLEERMKRLGFVTKAKVLELKVSDCEEKCCQVLNIPIGTNIFILRRLIYANEIPMVLSLSHLPYNLFPGFEKMDFVNKSIKEIIANDYGYRIRKVTKTIEAKVVSNYEAKLFNIKKESPVQYIETVSYVEENTPIEFTMERYRADKNKFSFVMNSTQVNIS